MPTNWDAATLRAALVKVRAHTSYLPGADRSLLVGLLQSIERSYWRGVDSVVPQVLDDVLAALRAAREEV